VGAKVPMPLDKRDWHPSVLPGQVVLVSTVDEDGVPNVAPKSWITMAAFGGPVVAFGCHVSHATYRNAAATGQFVVNVPPVELAERVWELPERHGAERLAHAGFTLLPAATVRPPLVGECRAHLECALDDVKHYDAEVFVFGRIVAMSVDEELLDGDAAERYARLRPFFFLEKGVYGALDGARSVAASPPLL
jgi:flavin reductase (DIM6/NTAB) family NADH-FMN oxidoreductase RutF